MVSNPDFISSGVASEQSCPSGTHVFSRDTCLCTCADSQARQACLDTGRTWSEERCECACAVSPGPACSVGLAWSSVTCTCAPEQLIALETEEKRMERSGPGLRETFLSWQMVTIIVLLLLIFILIITIFALISKLQTAKRRIKTAKLQASAQLTAARPGSEPLYDPLYSKTSNTQKDVIVKTKGAKNPDKLYSEIYSQQQAAAETGKLWENLLLSKSRNDKIIVADSNDPIFCRSRPSPDSLRCNRARALL